MCAPFDQVDRERLLVESPAILVRCGAQLHAVGMWGECHLDDAAPVDERLARRRIDLQGALEMRGQRLVQRVHRTQLPVCGYDYWLQHRVRPQPATNTIHIFVSDREIDN